MRRDIQFLRGFAVLVVVFYHSNIGIVNQGYLGVDVFFVISGFLITSIILKGLENHNFSFSEFYLRRAKRLLPALYSTLLFTSLMSFFVLTQQQWGEFLAQLQGALTFTANFVLPSQTGYFDGASDGKPLLHIWSLSLEEQYYFILPLALFFLHRKLRFLLVVALALLSFIWCVSWVYDEDQQAPFLWRIADASKSEWAFYLLFTRAWELLAGSICSFWLLHKSRIDFPRPITGLAFLLLLILCLTKSNSPHPGIESLVVVLATMVIIVGHKEWLPQNIIFRAIEKVGDWSYSVYLVHWPLFALLYLSYVGDVPLHAKLTAICLSFILGYLQFRYIECTFRDGKLKSVFSNWKTVISVTTIFISLATISIHIESKTIDNFSKIRRANFGIGNECGDGSFDIQQQLKPGCILGANPSIAVWGDSYAMHLIPGLAVKNNNLVQLTKSACGPILGLAPVSKGEYGLAWAKECLKFNDNVITYIKSNPNITHVIMSSTLGQYINFENGVYYTATDVIAADQKSLISRFQTTINELKKAGVTPIIFSPPPKAGFDIGECLERKYGPAILLRDSCEIDYGSYLSYQNMINSTLVEFEKLAKVVWLKDYLCSNNKCIVEQAGTFIYRDFGHLSVDGSIELLKNIDIASL